MGVNTQIHTFVCEHKEACCSLDFIRLCKVTWNYQCFFVLISTWGTSKVLFLFGDMQLYPQ